MKITNTIIFALSLLYAQLTDAQINHAQLNASPPPSPLNQDFTTAYSEGMVKGDTHLFARYFSENVKIMPEYDKSFLDDKNAEKYYVSMFKKYEITEYQRSILDLIDMGDITIEIGSFNMTVQTKGASKALQIPGTYFDLWNTTTSPPKLLSQAWNYDKKIEGIEHTLRSESAAGIHYAFEPEVVIDSPLTYEIAALNNFGASLMLKQEPDKLHLIYAEDCWNAHHNVPLLVGSSAIKAFLAGYTKNWPIFDYVSVKAHELYEHRGMVLEHFSYNLRWRKDIYSGVALGKGIRILKRNGSGNLQVYRIISMND